jgi:hypothetical protein
MRTRSCSCFVRVKWQKMTYNDMQVLLQDTPVKLKLLLETLTGVPVTAQKLSCAGKILKDTVPMYVRSFIRCVLLCNALCMMDSGVKSGALLQLLGHSTGGNVPTIAVLCKRVFESSKQGNAADVLVALQVDFMNRFST